MANLPNSKPMHFCHFESLLYLNPAPSSSGLQLSLLPCLKHIWGWISLQIFDQWNISGAVDL